MHGSRKSGARVPTQIGGGVVLRDMRFSRNASSWASFYRAGGLAVSVAYQTFTETTCAATHFSAWK